MIRAAITCSKSSQLELTDVTLDISKLITLEKCYSSVKPGVLFSVSLGTNTMSPELLGSHNQAP